MGQMGQKNLEATKPTFNELSNNKKADIFKNNYRVWKERGLNRYGYFTIFEGFLNSNILNKLNGNSLKLYLYFGLNSNNFTGECFHSIETIAKYFKKSERTIQNWITDLEKNNLIKRMQLKYNGVSYTFLQPYKHGTSEKQD